MTFTSILGFLLVLALMGGAVYFVYKRMKKDGDLDMVKPVTDIAKDISGKIGK